MGSRRPFLHASSDSLEHWKWKDSRIHHYSEPEVHLPANFISGFPRLSPPKLPLLSSTTIPAAAVASFVHSKAKLATLRCSSSNYSLAELNDQEEPYPCAKMDQLSNAFSILQLDVADNNEQTKELCITSGGKDVDVSSGDTRSITKENGCQNSETVYKLPLVWIDLEMTGLNVEVDRILEIACIITDGNLTKSIEGPDLVINQTKECLDRMGEWCQQHHAASGLTERVLKSAISEREAELQVIEFVKKHVGTYTPLIAGNSVYMDFIFLKKYMPELANLFSHTVVDVSSVKALCLRWYPRENKKAPQKENKHRAMDDIKESIAELRYYKEHIFKASKAKK